MHLVKVYNSTCATILWWFIHGKMKSTTIYEDNSACIAQLEEEYIKGDRIKHILPKFFFTHDLQRNGDIEIQKVHSCEN